MVRVKARGPQQKTVLEPDVIVLRKLNLKKIPDGIYDILARTNLEPGIQEEQMPWFDNGYIANNHPRDVNLVPFIMKATKGFAIARTDTGDILAEFGKDELGKADRVAGAARVRLDVDVDLANPVEEDEDNLLDDDEE